jgi:alpha-L-rhamnosidase
MKTLSMKSNWRTVCIAVLLFPGTSPAFGQWNGRWIDAAPSDGALRPDLAEADWIWNREPGVDLTKNAPLGPSYLRESIALPDDARIEKAIARFTADDSFTLWINGTPVESGTDWHTIQTADVTALLRPGRNVLAVEAVNAPAIGPVNAAGVIGALTVKLNGEMARTYRTGTDWKAAAPSPAGWQAPEYDNASWADAEIVAKEGLGPWGNLPDRHPGGDQTQNVWQCFRRTFDLSVKPSTAIARIAVDSKYWLWVNGRMVVFEGGLKRGPNPRDTYYDQVDLAKYLTAGRNTIAALTWYWGKDGFSHRSSGTAGFIFDMTANGTVVGSDDKWKAIDNPAYGDTGGEQPNFRLAETNIRFDARRDPGDWTLTGFDDSAWPLARGIAAAGAAPWNQLDARPIPEWKDFGLKDYANASSLPKASDGQPITALLPYNAEVTPYLQVDAPAGLVIGMQTDDYHGGGAANVRAEYVTRKGIQSYESYGWMNGQAVIYSIPPGVKILSLKYRETGFDTEFTGGFACDAPFYNKLWAMARRTLYLTMRDNYMDCPDRERSQWWGDAVNELGETFYSLSPSSALLTRKAIDQLCAWQRPDKTLYSPIPGKWDKELPQQMLASIGQKGFWTYYLYTGDKQTAVDAYPHVRDYLSLWKCGADGLVVHRKGDWDWCDWGSDIDGRVLDQAWYCLALEGAMNLARLAGKPNEASVYDETRKAVAEATNRIAWHGDAYRFPGYKGATDDRANALCVVAGIATPEKFSAIKRVLGSEYHASPYMEKYVLEALMLMDDPDDALARMKKRYGTLVDGSWTTLPELWDTANPNGTHNHAWAGGPLTILSQYFAGLEPLAPAWRVYQVRPQPGSLRDIQATADTVAGSISVAIHRGDRGVEVSLASPRGTTAMVSLPPGDVPPTAVEVNGVIVWTKTGLTSALPGVTSAGMVAGSPRFAVPPGTWRITWDF